MNKWKFNASQDKYTVVHTRKGNHSETLNAGIAAFRAGQHPNILMAFKLELPVGWQLKEPMFRKE